MEPRGLWPLLVVLGCASAPPVPKPWRHDPGPELLTQREGGKAASCRSAAEQLAATWKTDDEAWGAARAFSAACAGGDTVSCTALDGRFERPRAREGQPPAPAYPKEALVKGVQGEWSAVCRVDAEGRVSECRVTKPLPQVDAAIVSWLETTPRWPARLDGRPFACEYRFEVRLRAFSP